MDDRWRALAQKLSQAGLRGDVMDRAWPVRDLDRGDGQSRPEQFADRGRAEDAYLDASDRKSVV